MVVYFEVCPQTELTSAQLDRLTELKTQTLGYFEAQIFRDREDGTHYDAASPFAVADAAEADMLVAALQHEFPDLDFEVTEKQSGTGTKFNPVMI